MRGVFYGGQAVIEGVMMRGRRCMTVAVRAPDGQIALHSEPLTDWRARLPIAPWPVVRGLLLLADTLRLGMKALRFSAWVADGRASGVRAPDDRDLWRSLVISLLTVVGLLFLLPLAVVLPFDSLLNDHSSVVLEGVLRLGLLVGYLRLIGRLPEIQRLFGYHGAEHQVINAYEAGADLTPAAVGRFGLTHPRCGTGFLLIVVALAVVAFIVLGRPSLPLRIASRIVLLPLIVAVAYEYLRLTATFYQLRLARWLALPGLALQRLTTRPPDDDMRHVAIVALQQVLVADREPAATPATPPSRVDPPATELAPLAPSDD